MKSSNLFFFIFGRNPKLSLAEIISYFSCRTIPYIPHASDQDFLILEITGKFNPHKVAQDLAGTVKIGKIYIKSAEKDHVPHLLQEEVFYWEDTKSITFALSSYGTQINEQYFQTIFKNMFKEAKQKASLKKPNPSALCNALQRNNFIDIVVCKTDSDYYIGRTIAANDIKQNKRRYEQRPHVDESIGSSIRFSRILVNLSQLSKGKLLDPFCGIGTVVQEALMLGFEVVGSELLKDRVQQCKQNLGWISQQYSIPKTKYEIYHSDIRKLDEIIPRTSIDTVVTEPELGPLLKTIPNFHEAQSIIKSLENLYESTFQIVNLILKSQGTFVMVLPQIITSNGKKVQPNVKTLLNGTQLKTIPNLSGQQLTVSMPLYYKETWHRIGRLVYLFRKQ
jgi:tRNA G10  N-methylase Trm11